jgi:hypothetical protein
MLPPAQRLRRIHLEEHSKAALDPLPESLIQRK